MNVRLLQSNMTAAIGLVFKDKFAPLMAGVICVFVLYLRARSSFLSPQFWAEDGLVFWSQQATLGWKSIFTPYAGYYHLAPRLVAALSSLFDGGLAPTLYFAGSIVFISWSAATAASCVSKPRLGILLGIGLMLPPIGLGEILGNVTNVQWIMAPTLALVLLPNLNPFSINRIAYASIGALTGPFSIFLVPVAAYRIFKSKDLVGGIILVGALIQFLAILHHAAPPYPPTEGTIQHLVGVLAFRPFMYSTLCAILGFAVILVSMQKAQRDFRCVLLVFAMAVTTATLFRFWKAPLSLDDELVGARFFYIPRVAFIWCAMSIMFIDWRNTALAAAFILSLEFAGFDHLKKTPLPDAEWSKFYKERASRIKISPPGWEVTVPNR